MQNANNSIARLLLLFALLVAIAYLFLSPMMGPPARVILKTSMCVLLAVCALTHRSNLLALALLFSAAGDAFLAIDGQKLFVPGLASFLVTHVLYALIFLRVAPGPAAGRPPIRTVLRWVIPIFAIVYAVVLWPRLASLALPVAIYIAAIVVMAMLSLRVPGWLVPLGALLFMVSDSLIAMGKFLWSAGWAGPSIWITYAAAQLLITCGLLRLRSQA